MKSIITFSLFFTFLFSTTAQTTGKFRVYTKPSNSVIRLDTMRLTHGKPIELDTGKYTIKAWAPEREVVTKEITVVKGLFKTIPIKLPYTADYKKYRTKKKIYHSKKFFLRFAVLTGYAFYASSTLSENSNLKKSSDQHYKDALDYENDYNNAFWPTDIQQNRALYNESTRKYEKDIDQLNDNRKNLQIATGVTAVITFFTWKWASKIEKPTFKETPKLSRWEVNPVVSPTAAGLHMKFQF